MACTMALFSILDTHTHAHTHTHHLCGLGQPARQQVPVYQIQQFRVAERDVRGLHNRALLDLGHDGVGRLGSDRPRGLPRHARNQVRGEANKLLVNLRVVLCGKRVSIKPVSEHLCEAKVE